MITCSLHHPWLQPKMQGKFGKGTLSRGKALIQRNMEHRSLYSAICQNESILSITLTVINNPLWG